MSSFSALIWKQLQLLTCEYVEMVWVRVILYL